MPFLARPIPPEKPPLMDRLLGGGTGDAFLQPYRRWVKIGVGFEGDIPDDGRPTAEYCRINTTEG